MDYLDPEDVIDNEFYRVERLRSEEKAKLKLQAECEHEYYTCKCSKCQKILGSEIHYKRI